ncbi:hypothetical protein C5N14_27175 [Micromonospora sp. MW-13]|nr:hypothetical protein C5N14_27175 [Micromonospora sp. MW-13]
MAAREENVTNAARSRSAVASCSAHPASTFGAITVAMARSSSEVTVASASTPAVCTTAVSGCAGSTRSISSLTCAGSLTSTATADTRAPASVSSRTRAA